MSPPHQNQNLKDNFYAKDIKVMSGPRHVAGVSGTQKLSRLGGVDTKFMSNVVEHVEAPRGLVTNACPSSKPLQGCPRQLKE